MFGPPTEVQLARLRMTQNRAWLDDNIDSLRAQYANRWILVIDQRVTAEASEADGLEPHLQGRTDEAVIFKVPVSEIACPI